MRTTTALPSVQSFLLCPTPLEWVAWAEQNPQLLLIDHANCEKKAAATALNLMYRYVEYYKLLQKLSRLAREELRHFEQVIAIMKSRGVEYRQLSASRYAGLLRQRARTHEPGRLLDTLLIGAIIEARSCERFAALAPILDVDLGRFYSSLLRSEARHFNDYLKLAHEFASRDEVGERLSILLAYEKSLIEEPDVEFRFHSGVPPL